MAAYPPDSLVAVRPFARTRDGEEATIGDLDRQVFLAIPAEGLDILDALATGHTVGEAVRLYEEKYAETPDIEDFLAALASEGFVAPPAEHASAASGSPEPAPPRRRWSFDWIPVALAKRLCGTPWLVASGVIVGLAAVLVAMDPGIIPGTGVLLFPGGHFAALTWLTLAIALVAVVIHEFAHAVVARAAGAPASMGVGTLLYTLVAQTDISGMWLAPKRQRYLAFVSGTIVDAVAGSLLVGVLWANRRGFLGLSPTFGEPLVSAALFTYLLRISFQFFFYLRTDLYYVVATALNCKSLMADTEVFLRNLVARALRRPDRIEDQSALPPRELRAVRYYSVFYVAGRLFSLAVLAVFFIPLLWGYLSQVFSLVTGQEPWFGSADVLAAALTGIIVDGGGIALWVYGLYRSQRRRRTRVLHAS